MRLCFEVTVQDLVALHMRFVSQNSAIRSRQRFFQCFPPLLFLVLAINHFYIHADEPEDAAADTVVWVVMLVLSALWVWRSPVFFRRSFASNALKLYSNGSTSGLTGARKLELTASTLDSTTTAGESHYKYSSLLKVVSDDMHTFIYINSFFAIVIPHHLVAEGNLDEFVDALKMRIPAGNE